MGRAPCCEKEGLKRGRWSEEEDELLRNYILAHGEGSWKSLPNNAGLLRCGKSCRLRWINYLRSDLKRGKFSAQEDELIVTLRASIGNRWSVIAGYLPGRTDNEVKNYWNSRLSRQVHSFRRKPPLSAAVIAAAGSKRRSTAITADDQRVESAAPITPDSTLDSEKEALAWALPTGEKLGGDCYSGDDRRRLGGESSEELGQEVGMFDEIFCLDNLFDDVDLRLLETEDGGREYYDRRDVAAAGEEIKISDGGDDYGGRWSSSWDELVGQDQEDDDPNPFPNWILDAADNVNMGAHEPEDYESLLAWLVS